MNKKLILSDLEYLASKKLEYAKEELENNRIEWDDNYLNPKDYTSEIDDIAAQLNFNFYLGGYIALMELKEQILK